MYLNILKKDLIRKKTMNTILLLFIVLASMFVSSSINNIIAVSTALESFFEKSEMSDYAIGTSVVPGEETSLDDVMKEIDCITDYKKEPYIRINEKIIHNGVKLDVSIPVVTDFKERGIKYFDENNNEITEVNKGEVYVPYKLLESTPISIGDTITVKYDDKTINLKIKGVLKDAFLSSHLMGINRLVVNSEDYKYFSDSGNAVNGYMAYINTNDVSELELMLGKTNINTIFNGTLPLIKVTYIMDMIIAFILLAVSICLIFISFAVLRFSINFTLEEEFREIGVMKAIGIGNTKIRGLYLVKYLAISLAGSAIGFFAGLPFGKMLLDSVSKSIVMTIENEKIINLISSFSIVLIVMLFCFNCTRKVKKFTPIDAIRNGTTGERYNNKIKLSLSKSHSKPVLFMAVNDILSSFKRYAVMTFTFTVGFLLILTIANTAITLKSGNMADLISIKKSDVYLYSYDLDEFYTEDGRSKLYQKLSEIEKELNENDMSGKCSAEVMFKFSIEKGDKSTKSQSIVGVNTKTTDYPYLEGTAPQNTNEVAITSVIAERIDASIGDTVTINDMFGSKEYIVTAIYQSMNNMGEGIRLHEDTEFNYAQAMIIPAIQIDFDDKVNSSELAERIEKLSELYPNYNIYNIGEFIDYTIGGYGSTISNVKYLMLTVVLIVSILVIVLMERSFITKEKSEIALLKSMGFRNSTILLWHTIRIFVVMIISILIGELFSKPFSNVTMGQVFRMMGAHQIDLSINPVENLVIYPIVMLAVTLIAAAATALYTRSINASEISNIE